LLQRPRLIDWLWQAGRLRGGMPLGPIDRDGRIGSAENAGVAFRVWWDAR